MGREKRNLPAAVAGGPKERHKRAQRSQYDPKAPVPEGFVAKPAIPKAKYHSYFEFVENKDKKKKLEFKITSRKTPPPGFEFVPIGNPQLTTACKELSRGKDAMIFIVSNSKEVDSNHLAHQVHRIGHHIREMIVDEARAALGQSLDYTAPALGRSPEPIPKSQEEYNAQVDAAIRDLFPRVPNTDRQMIIEHAFRRGTTFKGDKPVGLSEDITLARRVQLAVLAHIRHTHTRYDTLLRETTWQNARKVVEGLCLDTLVKWRGDEETGRDQLDEILREVVVISDSEDEGSDQETDESSIEELEPRPKATVPARVERNASGLARAGRRRSPKETVNHNGLSTPAKSKGKVQKSNRKNLLDKKGQKGFKRYHAWQEAIRRYREEQDPEHPPPMDRLPNHPVHRQLTPRPAAPYTAREFPDPSELRAEPKDPGPVPTENGYVMQPSSYSGQPMDLSRRSYSPLPQPPVLDKVMSSHEVHTNVPALHSPIPMATNPLKDMLVPSIEPASPEYMRPSFVRAIPPRSQGFGGSILGSSMQYSPRRLSPLRGTNIRDEPGFSNRHVVGAQPTVRVNSLPGLYGDHHRQISNIPREQQYVSARDGYPISDSLVYRSNGRLVESSHHPASTRRPVEQVLRSGARSTPVLMEDRGGFFEIISARQVDAHSPPRTTKMMEYQQPVHREVRGAPEHRRVVSSQEGSRILRETRGSARVEFIPSPVSRPLPFGHQSRTVLPDSAVIRQQTPSNHMHGRGLDNGGHYPAYTQIPRVEPRPMSVDHLAQDQYREVRYDERPQGAQHPEPAHQHYGNESPARDDQYTPRRGYPLSRHRPENVIVLE